MNNSSQLINYGGWKGYTGKTVTFNEDRENDNATAYELILRRTKDAPPQPHKRLIHSRPIGGDGNFNLNKLIYNATRYLAI